MSSCSPGDLSRPAQLQVACTDNASRSWLSARAVRCARARAGRTGLTGSHWPFAERISRYESAQRARLRRTFITYDIVHPDPQLSRTVKRTACRTYAWCWLLFGLRAVGSRRKARRNLLFALSSTRFREELSFRPARLM